MTIKKQTNALVKWDEELAREAEVAAGMENSTAVGNFFSLKAGVLSWNDAPIAGNQMGVIILDHILENVFYEGKFDPEQPQSPTCFAFGRDEKELAPDKIVVDAGTAQSAECKGCPHNEWGSAETGRGKACRNTRRLAMIAAGNFDPAGKFAMFEDVDHYETSTVGFMKLPVTSVKGYAAFVKSLAGLLRRPPHGIVTKVKVVPDPKSQFKVTFEPLVNLPNELLNVVMKRRKEAKSIIDFPYTAFDADQAGAAKKPAGRQQPQRGRKY